MPLDDAAEVGVGGKRAEGLPPVAAQAGGAEGVGDGIVAVADERRDVSRAGEPDDDRVFA